MLGMSIFLLIVLIFEQILFNRIIDFSIPCHCLRGFQPQTSKLYYSTTMFHQFLADWSQMKKTWRLILFEKIWGKRAENLKPDFVLKTNSLKKYLLKVPLLTSETSKNIRSYNELLFLIIGFSIWSETWIDWKFSFRILAPSYTAESTKQCDFLIFALKLKNWKTTDFQLYWSPQEIDARHLASSSWIVTSVLQ